MRAIEIWNSMLVEVLVLGGGSGGVRISLLYFVWRRWRALKERAVADGFNSYLSLNKHLVGLPEARLFLHPIILFSIFCWSFVFNKSVNFPHHLSHQSPIELYMELPKKNPFKLERWIMHPLIWSPSFLDLEGIANPCILVHEFSPSRGRWREGSELVGNH